MVLRHIEALVDDARDGLDLRPELLLDALQIEAVVVRNQVDGQTEVSETTWEPWGMCTSQTLFCQTENTSRFRPTTQ